MEDNDTPWGVGSMDSSAKLAGFIKRSTIHCYTWPSGFIVDFFYHVCPIVSLWEQMTPVWAIFVSRGMTGRFYVSFGPCAFREDFFMYFHYLCLGSSLFGHQELQHGWQDLYRVVLYIATHKI